MNGWGAPVPPPPAARSGLEMVMPPLPDRQAGHHPAKPEKGMPSLPPPSLGHHAPARPETAMHLPPPSAGCHAVAPPETGMPPLRTSMAGSQVAAQSGTGMPLLPPASVGSAAAVPPMSGPPTQPPGSAGSLSAMPPLPSASTASAPVVAPQPAEDQAPTSRCSVPRPRSARATADSPEQEAQPRSEGPLAADVVAAGAPSRSGAGWASTATSVMSTLPSTTATDEPASQDPSGFTVPVKSLRRKTHFAEKLAEVVPVPVADEPRRLTRKSSVPISQQVIMPAHRSQQQSVFDDYEFLGEKGGGAFGRVMQVQHKEARFQRACKVVAIRSRRHFSAVETEAALMRRLDHPHVIALFESYYDGDRNIYLIIELCTGGSLADRIKQNHPTAIPEAQAGRIARDLFSAVQYCHRRGVVHRDLKTENALFSHGGADAPLKVIDFGLSDFRARLARIERTDQSFGVQSRFMCIGTPHYMAPEIYASNVYDEKVDAFACGVMLAEMLTGVHPFFELGKDNLQSIREKIVSGAVDYGAAHWKSVDGRAKDLVQKLLLLNRKQRVGADGALQHPWLFAMREKACKSDAATVNMEVFSNLESFARWHVLGQAACRVLAHQLDDESLALPRADFRLLDSDSDGAISGRELLEGARHCGLSLEPEILSDLMQSFNRTGSSFGGGEYKISWLDFQAANLLRVVTPTTEQLLYVFRRFCDSDGTITPDSLQRSLSSFLSVSHPTSPDDYVPVSSDGEVVSKDELDRVFAEAGSFTGLQGLGAPARSINFKHFRAMMHPTSMDRKSSI